MVQIRPFLLFLPDFSFGLSILSLLFLQQQVPSRALVLVPALVPQQALALVPVFLPLEEADHRSDCRYSYLIILYINQFNVSSAFCTMSLVSLMIL